LEARSRGRKGKRRRFALCFKGRLKKKGKLGLKFDENETLTEKEKGDLEKRRFCAKNRQLMWGNKKKSRLAKRPEKKKHSLGVGNY